MPTFDLEALEAFRYAMDDANAHMTMDQFIIFLRGLDARGYQIARKPEPSHEEAEPIIAAPPSDGWHPWDDGDFIWSVNAGHGVAARVPSPTTCIQWAQMAKDHPDQFGMIRARNANDAMSIFRDLSNNPTDVLDIGGKMITYSYDGIPF